MNRINYVASGGQEVFLSFESKDSLSILGFLRLRDPALPHREEIRAQGIAGYGRFRNNTRITCLWCFCGYRLYARK